jgi:hypothetical protein
MGAWFLMVEAILVVRSTARLARARKRASSNWRARLADARARWTR